MEPLNPIYEGKRRASRIQLDHYKRPSWMTRIRWLLAALALLAAIGYAVWSLATPRAAVLLSHGELSEPHALWNAECSACHLPGVPLKLEAVRLGPPPPDAPNQCQKCHPVSGHHSLPDDSVQRCAACHREHRGRDADINRVADGACTACHGGDNQALPPGVSLASVTRFPDQHPDFKSLPTGDAADPGRLHFSHSRHMRLGLTSDVESKASERYILDYIPEEYREAYRLPDQSPADPVQLACSSCHKMKETDAEGGARIYAPVTYAASCKACHPLLISRDEGGATLPHGLSKEATLKRLDEYFRSACFPKAAAALDRQEPRRTPGRSEILGLVGSIDNKVAGDTRTATLWLGDQCRKCHEMASDNPTELEVTPTSVPRRWLTGARFDHYEHRTLNCAECHAAAYKKSVDLEFAQRGRESDEVMIPGKANCARCHAPQATAQGGFRYDCVLCHRYHDHDYEDQHPRATTAGDGLTIDGFLQGDTDAQAPR